LRGSFEKERDRFAGNKDEFLGSLKIKLDIKKATSKNIDVDSGALVQEFN